MKQVDQTCISHICLYLCQLTAQKLSLNMYHTFTSLPNRAPPASPMLTLVSRSAKKLAHHSLTQAQVTLVRGDTRLAQPIRWQLGQQWQTLTLVTSQLVAMMEGSCIHNSSPAQG